MAQRLIGVSAMAASLARRLRPKNKGPDQWVPVITRATSDSDL